MKTTHAIIALALSAIATATSAGLATPQHQHHEFVDRMFEAFNAHDADALAALYAEDGKAFSPESCGPRVGSAEIAASYKEMFAMIPDVHDRVESVITEGDKIAVTFTATGTINGQPFSLPVASFMQIKDGKVIEERAYFDTDMPPDCDKDDGEL